MDWNWLHTNYPIIYTQRKAIVDERIKQKLNALSTTIVTDFDNDPNCLIHSYLHHIDKDTDQNVQNERKNLFEFMVNHPNESTENLKYENGSYLHDIHVQALHEMNQINIIVLEYTLEIDKIAQQNAYYDSSFQDPDTLVLFHRAHLNQYDHCHVHYAKSEYIAPCVNGSIYNKLKQFDDAFIHNHENIQYVDYQPPPNVNNHDLPPEIDLETAIRRLDFSIGMYCIVMDGTRYAKWNVSHRGKFYKYITRNKLSKRAIYDELNGGVPQYCLFGDFNQFPIHSSWPIHSDIDKRYAIFYIIKYCFTFHRPPSIAYIKSKLQQREHRADRIVIDQANVNHFPHTVLNCKPLQQLESLMKKHTAFAHHPKHVQHTMDEIDAVDLDRTYNNYLYLFECFYADKTNKELIYLVLGLCEKKDKCTILSRQCRKNKEKHDLIKRNQLYFLQHLKHSTTTLSSEEEQRAIDVFQYLDKVHVTFQHPDPHLYQKSFHKQKSSFIDQFKQTYHGTYDAHDPFAEDQSNVDTNAILCRANDVWNLILDSRVYDSDYEEQTMHRKTFSELEAIDSDSESDDEQIQCGVNNVRQIRSLRSRRYNQNYQMNYLPHISQSKPVQIDNDTKTKYATDDIHNKAYENKAEHHRDTRTERNRPVIVQLNKNPQSMHVECNQIDADSTFDEALDLNTADAYPMLHGTGDNTQPLKVRPKPADVSSQLDRQRSGDHSMNDTVDEINNRTIARDRLSRESNRTNNPNDEERNDDDDQVEVKRERPRYHLGFRFVYKDHQLGYHGAHQQKNVIYVHPKYRHLQEELLQNEICTISKEQFNNEATKAQLQYDTNYFKKIQSERMLSQHASQRHLLSLQLYCNYTIIQSRFSRTYREHNGSQHSSFYHMGRLLTEAIRFLGTKPTRAWTLYHGINQSMLFESYVHDIQINGPLSTSTSLAVAAQFADNKGMVIALQDGKFNSSCCLDVSPLSDFVNEREVLFVQNPGRLRMVDIFDSVTRMESRHIG
eukprot:374819_1